ncbi:MAG: tyrosine--tRNA ligase [Rickettsiales bacterium]|nr:tyrosine--tRNA ligase [Rickettsiales bacterium]|tara:strand:- start:83039 stop:84337 length:1299 start_codon:yes stop_codon:yes gene_type:complete
MTQFKSSALQELQDRGFIYQCTDLDALDAAMVKQPITFYCGYDATADSLHVGNLLTIMAARVMQRHGHKPLMIVGGGTTKIGDPSGRSQERNLLDTAQIDQHLTGIKKSLQPFINFNQDTANGALLLNNDTWLQDLKYLDFLRTYGPHFTINRLLTFDSVRTRLERESPLSFLEFNYILIQAYDFLHLNRQYNCQLQIGGSDQWANMLNGYELIRKLEKSPSYALTLPLIENADGQKMGKTAAGAVWINGDKLSPLDYWQFWRNIADQDVVKLLKLYTDLSVTEISAYENLSGADINKAKILLADHATTLAHGSDVLADIHATVGSHFNKQETLEVTGTDAAGHPILKTAAPVVQIKAADLSAGHTLIQALTALGFAKSNGEARRLIQGGGCRVNDQKAREDRSLTGDDIVSPGVIKIAAGKKKLGYLQVLT